MAVRRTYEDLLAAVRDNVDEATASYWTSATMMRTITRAADVVWLEARKLRVNFFQTSRLSTAGVVSIYGESYDCASFALVAGTRQYTLPPDCAEIRLIEAVTSGYEHVEFVFRDLTDPDVRRARAQTTQSSPTTVYCTIVGERSLEIAPLSDAALDLRLTYVPDTIIVSSGGVAQRSFEATTDQLVLPHPLYMAVEEVATWRAQLMDRDPNAAAWIGVARESVARFQGAVQRQSQDQDVVRGVFE